jgi:hypothetical protein
MTRGRSEGDGGRREDEGEEKIGHFIDNYPIKASNSRSEVLPLKSVL